MDPRWVGGRGGSYSTDIPHTGPLQPAMCSVPGDLPREWQYLRTQVFPHLDAFCQARGTRFRPVDIQWNESESRYPSDPICDRFPLSSQQLKVSLDLITHSSSFLCLLGHRYGPFRPEDTQPLPATGPEREALSGVERNQCVAAKGGYPWVLTGRNQTCSLTELQVTQAALMGDPRRCFFYFRDYSLQGEEEVEETDIAQRISLLGAFSRQTEHERQKIRAMKNRIVDSLQPVRFFRTLQDLGDAVKRDWRVLIEQIYGPSLDQHRLACSDYHQDSLDRCCHDGAVHGLCRWFVPSTQTTIVLETLNTFTLGLTHSPAPPPRNPTVQFTGNHDNGDFERSIFLLCGERGCGKSSLAAWWLQEFRKKNPKILVIPWFCGINNSSVDIRSVLRQLTMELRWAHYGSQAKWSEGLQDRVEPKSLHAVVQAFTAAAALGPCVLVLDGLDRLTGTLGLSMPEVKELHWLPDPLPPQCKLVITTTFTDLTYKSLTLRPDVCTLPWLGLSDFWVRRSILLKHLTLPYQEPPRTLLQSLMGRKLCRLPLALVAVASELQTCSVLRGEREEEDLLEEYVEMNSMAELWAKVIQRWVKDYGGDHEGMPCPAKETGPHSQVSKTELGGWVWDVLCLVHLSHAGLTEEQVLVLLEVLGHRGSMRVLPLEWARFCSATRPWVQERPNGALSLSHQSLSQAMDLLMLRIRPGKGPGGLRKTRRAYQLTLAQFFQRQGRELSNWAVVLEELPWHLENCEVWGQMHTFLTDPETVKHLSTSWSQSPQLRIDIVRYWTHLILRGYEPYSSYQSLLGKECHPTPPGQSARWVFPRVTLADIDPPEQGDVDSSGAFMTETQSEGQEAGGLWEPAVKGRIEVFVSELLLCLNMEGKAEQFLLQARTTLTQVDEQDTDSMVLLLTVQQSLAELYVEMAQLREAEMYCSSALEAAETLTTTCSEEPKGLTLRKGQLLCMLCQLLFADGRAEEASQILSDIINMGHHKIHLCAEATVSFLQGIHRLSLQDPNEAEHHFQSALTIRRRWYGREHPLVVEVEEYLADIWAETISDTGLRQRQAVELYRHAMCVKDQEMKLCPLTSPLAQPKGCSLVVTLVKLGRQLCLGSSKAERREADGLLQRALDLHIRFLGPDHTQATHIQQILNTEFRQPVTTGVPRSRPLSHRRLSMSRPSIGTPLYPHLGWDRPRSITHTALVPPGKTSMSARSYKAHTQPELEQELTQEPVENQNRSLRQKRLSSRPCSAFQTTVFGPQSDISNLVPVLTPRPASTSSSRSTDRARAQQRAGWCQLPGRYLLEEQRVMALNRQIGCPLHTHRRSPLLRQTGQGGEQSCKHCVAYSSGRR